jgi:GNAT superfamily N-acetyltransferase
MADEVSAGPHEAALPDGFSVSTDPARLDLSMTHEFLSKRSYWAAGITIDLVRRSVENSICFGLYHHDRQIGFARVVTDRATFAYLGDVFVHEDYRNRGLSKWLLACVMRHPDLQGLRRIMLGTRDAHGLYEQFGFMSLASPERFMEIFHPDIYEVRHVEA